MNAKTVNYTPEQTQKMINDYQAGVSVETIAENLGKTVRSIVAKLSREKVYIKKEYKTKTGESVTKKDAHADAPKPQNPLVDKLLILVILIKIKYMSSGFKENFERGEKESLDYDDSAFYFFGFAMLMLVLIPATYYMLI